MADPKYRLNQLHGRFGDLVYQFTRVQFTQQPAPGTWSPAVNAYRCPLGYAICVDLAGVPREQIRIGVHGRTLRIEGNREVPEPKGKDEEPVQIVTMEIDAGGFMREVQLPTEVQADAIKAEYREGLLWVYLPFRSEA
ncbi:MAG TPA: Hsp20/alpha crystallin family protein [Candidatus Kapabacteria bacterium]|nr:Hsp20/alpha crystallin family protein [Candidatus Kapabacteria bacterium]